MSERDTPEAKLSSLCSTRICLSFANTPSQNHSIYPLIGGEQTRKGDNHRGRVTSRRPSPVDGWIRISYSQHNLAEVSRPRSARPAGASRGSHLLSIYLSLIWV
jgi:hypothetical protein